MLKFHLCAERPSVAEVIAQTERHMGQVKPSMALVTPVTLWGIVSIETLAIEIPCHDRLSVTAYADSGHTFCDCCHMGGVGIASRRSGRSVCLLGVAYARHKGKHSSKQ